MWWFPTSGSWRLHYIMTYFYLWLTVAMSQQSIFRACAGCPTQSTRVWHLCITYITSVSVPLEKHKPWWGFSKAGRLPLFLLRGYFDSFKPKKTSVINLSTSSSVQYDLNFNCPFSCSVYNEAHLPNNRTWRESWTFASSQLWWLFPLEQAAAKWWFHSGLIWDSKSCVKHRLKRANLRARLAQRILKPYMCSAMLLTSHQCTWLSHSSTGRLPLCFCHAHDRGLES